MKFFAAPREAIGAAEVEQELPSGATVRELMALLTKRYPVLSAYSGFINIVVNHASAGPQTELHDGDEVACLPPVGGG
ncbi:MAG: MoaD/ThiS family protein [Chloroflexota bacterium]|nr:MoaD/ThiS family protein [Chloroflexota bacterium]